MTPVLVIINNYFHDVATAVLLSSAVILWTVGRIAETRGDQTARCLSEAYPVLTRFAIGALVWIVVGGIPRTIFFTRYEWDPAVVKGIVPALVVKHVLMATVVVIGGLMWARLRRRVQAYRATAQR